jgi:hypothetical protein
MTPNEFKAWFDGFTEAFDKTPSQKQWARIKERVAEIDGKTVTEKVFVDRYWQYIPYTRPPYYGPYYGSIYATNSGVGSNYYTCNATVAMQAAQAYQNSQREYGNATQGQLMAYNSLGAMGALGRAEAQAMIQ